MKKIMVITGASSGIGREFAIQLDKKEKVDEIWVIARTLSKLEDLKNILSTPIKTISIDLSNTMNIEEYKKLLEQEKPEVRVLVNASGYGKFNHYENISDDINQNMINLNINALVAMVDFTLPYIGKNSHIINIASCAGFQPIPYINVYASTKAFVLNYSRALNVELKYKNTSVTAVTPFWTKTGFFDRAIMDKDKQVVIKYTAMYDPKKVVEKAIKNAYNNKEISCYGFVNNFQHILTKILPHKLVMKIWMHQQKYDGTPNIR